MEGHPRTVFHWAIERGNLLLAETTAREIGHVSLAEALELTGLIAQHDRRRGSRAAARWLRRYLNESGSAMIQDAALAVGCLSALGGANHS